jgi:hypothetical protein
MPNSFANLVASMKSTLPKAKSPKRNAAHYAAQAASVRAQRNAIAKSLAAIARRSPKKAAALNASILARVEKIEKALNSPKRKSASHPKVRRVQNRKGRVISMYIPAPPSLNKLAKEAKERNEMRRQLNQWVEAEKRKLGGVIKKY